VAELQQLGYWLAVICVFIGAPILITRRALARRVPDEYGGRARDEAADRIRPDDELDELADVLAQIRRRERLQADVQRVQRILANDTWMSATRQLGNRIAYTRLLLDLEATRDFWEPSWNLSALPTRTTTLLRARESQRHANVEILDIKWGR
jgi:hypothetical protein